MSSLPRKKLVEIDEQPFLYHYALNDLSLHKKMYLIYNGYDENKKGVYLVKLSKLVCKRKNFSLSELKFNFSNVFDFIIIYENENYLVIELKLKN